MEIKKIVPRPKASEFRELDMLGHYILGVIGDAVQVVTRRTPGSEIGPNEWFSVALLSDVKRVHTSE